MRRKKASRRGQVRQKEARFLWTKPRLKAALEVAKDELTNEQIAEACGIVRATLDRWKTRPQFRAKVDQHRKAWAEAFKSRGLAERQNRIDALNDRHRRMQQIIDERAAAPEMQQAPGGKSGLLTRQERVIGSGEAARVVDVYELDTGLLKEMREHERQTAQELGQWLEKRDVTIHDIDAQIERELARVAGRGEAGDAAPAPADEAAAGREEAGENAREEAGSGEDRGGEAGLQ